MRNATRIPQRVFIVGGSSEIGGALARSWLDLGTGDFVVTERSPGRAGELVADLESRGADVRTVLLDATSQETVSQGLEEALEGDDFDVAVIAIGLLGDQEEMEKDPARAWDIVTVNATGTIQIALHVARRLEEQQFGTLVLLSSVAGQRGRRDNYVYGASKAALDTFAEGLQQRFAESEVNVTVVRPGYVYSKMSAGIDPAPFAVTVEQSRDRIVKAVEHGVEVVWVPPLLRVVFFILGILPRRLWAAIVARVR